MSKVWIKMTTFRLLNEQQNCFPCSDWDICHSLWATLCNHHICNKFPHCGINKSSILTKQVFCQYAKKSYTTHIVEPLPDNCSPATFQPVNISEYKDVLGLGEEMPYFFSLCFPSFFCFGIKSPDYGQLRKIVLESIKVKSVYSCDCLKCKEEGSSTEYTEGGRLISN